MNKFENPVIPEQIPTFEKAVKSVQQIQETLAKVLQMQHLDEIKSLTMNLERMMAGMKPYLDKEYGGLLIFPDNISVANHIREMKTFNPEMSESVLKSLRREGLDPNRRRIGFFQDRD